MAFRSTYGGTFDYLARLGQQGISVGNNTLAARVRFDNLSGAYEVIEINDSGGFPYDSAILLTGNQIQYCQRTSTASIDFVGPTTIAANTWYHVALTYDGTTLRGYLNGAPNGTSTGLTGTRGIWNDLQIGPAQGYLADACFYTEALSAEEILQLALQRLPQRRSALWAHIPCFSGAAARVIDYSGNGRNFTAVGSPADSTVPDMQTTWGTRAGASLYTDSSATPIAIDATGATQWNGNAQVGESKFIDPTGATQWGGTAQVGETKFVAAVGPTQWGGNTQVVERLLVPCTGATQWGGSCQVGLALNVSSSGATQWGGNADASGGGGGGSGNRVKLWRRFRRGRG